MDTKLQSFLDKVKDTASRTGRSVGRAADAAGKKASEMAAATRLNLRIFDLNTECDVLFRDIGRMVYELHRGDEVTSEDMDAKLEEVDAKKEQLAELRDQVASLRSVGQASTIGLISTSMRPPPTAPAAARTPSVPAAARSYNRLNGVRI